jgi:hypothetical protein
VLLNAADRPVDFHMPDRLRATVREVVLDSAAPAAGAGDKEIGEIGDRYLLTPHSAAVLAVSARERAHLAGPAEG